MGIVFVLFGLLAFTGCGVGYQQIRSVDASGKKVVLTSGHRSSTLYCDVKNNGDLDCVKYKK